MRKKLATVTAHRDQNGHSQPWLSRDHTEDAVIELWLRRDWAVTSPWLSCDLS